MPEMIWGNPVDKRLEAGVSKGILFTMNGTGVPWNGLQNVNVEVNGGETESLWYDGVKYLELAAAEDFQATILGLNSPDEFRACEGYNKLNPYTPGMYVPGTGYREKFNLVWRTEVGNQAEGFDYGYKLHVAYNCYVAPSARQFATLGDATNPDQRSWTIRTTPACGRFSYYVFHSNEADLSALEALLYNGTLPPCSELPQHVSEPGSGGGTPTPDDSDCPKLLVDFEKYLPGQFLDEDEVSDINEALIYGMVSSGLDFWDLPASGAFVANDSDATETGTHPVLTDDSDATYIGSSAGDLGYTVKLPALFGFNPGSELQLELRMAVSGGVSADDPDNVDADAQIFITTDADGDLPVGGFSDGTDDGMSFAVEVVDGTIQDYVVPLNMDSWTDSSIEDVVTALEAGAYLNVVAVNNNNPDTTPDVKIYEAKVVILDDTNPEKALRVRTPDDSGWVENHIYDVPGGDDAVAANTTSVDFYISEVPLDTDYDLVTIPIIKWLIAGSDNDPGFLDVEAMVDGVPGVKWVADDSTTHIDSALLAVATWYTATAKWLYTECRIQVFNRETGEIVFDHTVDATDMTPTAFVQHYVGVFGSLYHTYEAMVDNVLMQVHCHEEPPPPPSGDYELVILPTSMTSEGSADGRHSPFTVGTASTALTDGDDASYGWATWLRTVKGVYPLWTNVAPTEPVGLTEIDPAWITSIATRFRAKAVESDAVFYPCLFGNVSKLLTYGNYGSRTPLGFTAANTWQDFEYVFDDTEYDVSGWAPDGMQSALEITSYLYTRTIPVNPSDHSISGDYNIQVSEQCLVIYFTIP